MAKRDYYEVLGVNKAAEDSEIKKAYRKLSKEHHPDKGGDEEIFKEVAEAYDVLSTPEKKTKYDTYGHNGPQAGGGMSMEDIMSQFGFGGGRQQRRGTNIQLTIQLTLEDCFNGVTKKVKYNKMVGCNTCKGVGGSDFEDCKPCGGRGVVAQIFQTPMGRMQQQTICSTCDGEGKKPKKPCVKCSGNGIVKEEVIVDIQVPIGIDSTNQLNVGGGGNAVKSGPDGDLLVRINILEHKDFIRDEFDLHYVLDLHYHQLVLGDKVEIPTIDGTKIRFEVGKGSPSGKVMRIPNKGLRKLNYENRRGNMNVTLNIIIPEVIDAEEEEIIKKLGEKVESVEKN